MSRSSAPILRNPKLLQSNSASCLLRQIEGHVVCSIQNRGSCVLVPYFHSDCLQKILVPGSSSGTGSTTPSAPSGVQCHHEDLQLIEDRIRDLKKARDKLKIKNLEKELNAAKCELRHMCSRFD